MDRRALLASIAVASIGAAPLAAAPFETLKNLINDATMPVPTRVGLADIDAVRRATDVFTSCDLRYGGGTAAAMARAQLTWAVGLLDAAMTDRVRPLLHSAVAALVDRVAWASYDADDSTSAGRLYPLALRIAATGNDPDLRAHVLLDTSTYLADTGFAADAVAVIRLGLGDERITPAVRANLHGVAARHCAAMGDPAAGRRHLRHAEDTLADADPANAPSWGRRFLGSDGHFDSVFGLAAFAVDEPDTARTRLGAACRVFDRGRTRTALRCRARLAVLHLRAGEVAAGEQEARRSVLDARTVRSVRVGRDVRMLRRECRGHAQLADLADFADRTD